MARHERKVLLVDDDADLRRLLAHRIREWGYEPIELSAGEKVVRALTDEDCHCVLLDIELPDCCGLELLRAIKQVHGGVKVIMLTGVVSVHTLLQSMRRGAEAVIFKPITDWSIVHKRLLSVFESIDEWWASLEEMKRRKDEQRLFGLKQPIANSTELTLQVGATYES